LGITCAQVGGLVSSDGTPLDSATVACGLPSDDHGSVPWEWAGIFATPGSSYTWLAQQVNGAYADPTMQMVVLPATDSNLAALTALEMEAIHSFNTTCIVVAAGGTITPAMDTCYELHFTSTATDTTFNIDASSAAHIAFFAQHVPTEFERDTHYLQDPSGTDIEPAAQESVAGGDHAHGHDHGGATETCGCASQEADHPFTIDCTDTATIRTAGQTLLACNSGIPAASACQDAVATDPTCQIAFFVIQAHHDHCPHDTLTTAEESLFHDWESSCLGCSIARQYDSSRAMCPTVDCSNTSAAETNHATLAASCTSGGVCCQTTATQEAFHVILAYHDLCDHSDVPQYVEVAVHDYEAACEAYFCNAVSAPFDATACAATSSPPPSPSTSSPPPSPSVPCLTELDVTSWPDTPVNEPCYVHDAVCQGYPVCCVTYGTCISQHGGMVSSNALYYEGGCHSEDSSHGITAPGCQGKQGECNVPYLQSAMGASTSSSAISTVSDAVLARLAHEFVHDATPCVVWDSVEVEFTMPDASISDFGGRWGQATSLCRKIASAAGVPNAYVSCEATPMGTSSGRRLEADSIHDGLYLGLSKSVDVSIAEAAEAAGFGHSRRLQSTGSGCYNADGTHTCDCTTSESSCTGTWTAGCQCAASTGASSPSPPPPAPPAPPPGGVHFIAVIHATGPASIESVLSNLTLTMGTAAAASATLSSSSYVVNLATAPTITVRAGLPPSQGPDASSGELSSGDLPIGFGPGTVFNSDTNQCEVSCSGSRRTLAEDGLAELPSPEQILDSYLTSRPDVVAKLDDETRRHMLNLLGLSEQYFGQPAVA
jgi:hypothetical protein